MDYRKNSHPEWKPVFVQPRDAIQYYVGDGEEVNSRKDQMDSIEYLLGEHTNKWGDYQWK